MYTVKNKRMECLRNKIVFRTIIIVLFVIPFTLIELCQWIRH